MGLSVGSVERSDRVDTWTYKPIVTNDIKPEETAMNTRLEFISGLEQVQENSSNSKKLWTLTYGGTKDILESMHTFWYSHKDGSVFYWTPPAPFDTQGVYRFATDKWNPTAKYGCSASGTSFEIVGFTIEIQLRWVSAS